MTTVARGAAVVPNKSLGYGSSKTPEPKGTGKILPSINHRSSPSPLGSIRTVQGAINEARADGDRTVTTPEHGRDSSSGSGALSMTTWALPSDPKKFTRGVKLAIQTKLERGRADEASLQSLESHCRKLVHERVVRKEAEAAERSNCRTALTEQRNIMLREAVGMAPPALQGITTVPLTVVAKLPSILSGETLNSNFCNTAEGSVISSTRCVSPTRLERLDEIKTRSIIAQYRGERARQKKEELELQYYEVVTRKYDEPTPAAAARQWKVVLLAFLFASSAAAQRTSSNAKRRAVVSPPPPVPLAAVKQKKGHPSSLRGGGSNSNSTPSVSRLTADSTSGTPSVEMEPLELVVVKPLRWILARAAGICIYAAMRARKRVATERVLNMLRGAKRMQGFHTAMRVFRSKLMMAQRGARSHLSLLKARKAMMELAWQRSVHTYRQMICNKFDPDGSVRKQLRPAAASSPASEEELISFTPPPPPSLAVRNAVAAQFMMLPSENSFRFVPNAALQLSVDFSDDVNCSLDAFSMPTGLVVPRRQSVVSSLSGWRPLEFRRRMQQDGDEINMGGAPASSAVASQSVSNSALKSTQQDGNGAGEAANANDSPQSPLFGHLSLRDTTLQEVLTLVEDEPPEKRRDVILSRLCRHLNEYNEFYASHYQVALNAYKYDLDEANKLRRRGQYAPMPKRPKPRHVRGVIHHDVMLAFVKLEFDEMILRSLSATAKKAKPSMFPKLEPSTTAKLEEFRLEERHLTKVRRNMELERQRQAELKRDVDPVQFPSVSRKDTLRIFNSKILPTADDDDDD